MRTKAKLPVFTLWIDGVRYESPGLCRVKRNVTHLSLSNVRRYKVPRSARPLSVGALKAGSR